MIATNADIGGVNEIATLCSALAVGCERVSTGGSAFSMLTLVTTIFVVEYYAQCMCMSL